eukprot:TRINITY_DN1212_c0_g8_i1.p1 TRINITY_DN1212_c0_g8~~TRINITY_DN1212_c0_g8_i1.p1  ORF type:complete len:233 (+),score=92.66 TRINITY_DN1212_c0_g8_i1:287-985(+)
MPLPIPRGGVGAPSGGTTTLGSLLAKRDKAEADLKTVEKQIYDLETTYLNESSQVGNVLRGFDGFLTANKAGANTKRPRRLQVDDRLFSLSSLTSPAVEERAALREAAAEGRPEGVAAPAQFGHRMKGNGALAANGPGKLQQHPPMKQRGRPVPRDGAQHLPALQQQQQSSLLQQQQGLQQQQQQPIPLHTLQQQLQQQQQQQQHHHQLQQQRMIQAQEVEEEDEEIAAMLQ